jgi:hypothetical protein
MFGQRYKSSELDYSSWVTLGHSIDATEKSLNNNISKDINSLKKLLLTTIKKNSDIEKISGLEINSTLDIISHTIGWDLEFDQALILNNDEFYNSYLASEFKSLMELPNIPREQIFAPLRDILSEYIELPDNLDNEQISPEIILLLVLGIAIATLRDESGFDGKRNRRKRRDNACYWYARFTIDWIYNFGNVEYLDVGDDKSDGEPRRSAPSPFNPLSW